MISTAWSCCKTASELSSLITYAMYNRGMFCITRICCFPLVCIWIGLSSISVTNEENVQDSWFPFRYDMAYRIPKLSACNGNSLNLELFKLCYHYHIAIAITINATRLANTQYILIISEFAGSNRSLFDSKSLSNDILYSSIFTLVCLTLQIEKSYDGSSHARHIFRIELLVLKMLLLPKSVYQIKICWWCM